jgi:uncharacterized protein
MTGIFLDTVGLLAVWDASDQWHVPADAVFNELLAENRPLLTTSYVLLECGNAAARRPYRARVKVLRELLRAENLLFDPTEAELSQAWHDYDRGVANQVGIVDQVSFQVMRRLGLNRAFTNDQHFVAAGFEICWQ